MDYYEDYEAYSTVYEDETLGCALTQQDLDDCVFKNEVLVYDIDKDIREMLDYDPDLYNSDFERVFRGGK